MSELGAIHLALSDEHALQVRRAKDGHPETAAFHAWRRDRLVEQIRSLEAAMRLEAACEEIDRTSRNALYEFSREDGAWRVGVDEDASATFAEAIVGCVRRMVF